MPDYNDSAGRFEAMEEEIDDLKKQLKHKQSKKFFNCSSCLLIVILILLAAAILSALIIAKSGLGQIPILSDYFYHQPEPVYQVGKSDFGSAALVSRLAQLASAQAFLQQKITNLNVNFELNEQEVTALLREIIRNGYMGNNIDFIQLAIDQNQGQLFLIAKSPKNLMITLDFIPSVSADHQLVLQTQSFKVGDLTLPKIFGKFFIEYLGAKMLNQLLGAVSLAGSLESVKLAGHQAQIQLLISNIK